MAQQIQWRRGSAAAWTAADPIMAEGEAGYEIDTNKFKIGDGVQAWSALPYFEGGGGTAADVSYVNTTSGLVADDVQEAIDELVTVPKFSAGCVTVPTYTKTSDSLITVDAVTVYLYKTTDFSGGIFKYALTSKALSMTDNTSNYIVAKYNAGSPTLAVTTSVSDINESDVIPVLTIYRSGSVWHTVNWDSLGLGIASKLHYSIVKTQRYRRESGLSFSVNGSLQVSVDAGIVWIAANSVSVDAASSVTDSMFLCSHSGGVWTTSTVTTLNNTQYDDGTNLATLTANRYAVNWVYRGVETQKHIYVTLGTGDYTLDGAQTAQPPSPPPLISSHAVLIGKVIYQKSSSTYYSLQSAFDTAFVTAGVTDHADLTGLTDAGAHPAAAIAPDTTNFNGNLSSSDDTTQKALDTLDNLKLDTIDAPTDTTNNNATTSAHGLLPKLSGSASDALKGDGSWGSVSGGSSLKSTTVTITTGDWSAGSTTKTLTGMTSTAIVWVSPNAASYAVFVNSVVRCTGQSTNSITFTCDSTPASSITVNVAYMEPTT